MSAGLAQSVQTRLVRHAKQLDVGIGDAVTPPPEWIEYPSLLDLPRPRVRAYRRETAIAEKVHAMVVLDRQNSRMRDFFDVHTLATREAYDGQLLTAAIVSTFARRGTAIPTEPPIALTPDFATVEGKQEQWNGFVRRSRLASELDLRTVVEGVASFVQPVLTAAARSGCFAATWPPGGPWRS